MRRAGGEVTLIDLRDVAMPLYDGDIEAQEGLPPGARELKRLMLDHHGFLISAPEYNSSISAVLKNAIDWVSRPQPDEPPAPAFRGKVAGLLAASPGNLGRHPWPVHGAPGPHGAGNAGNSDPVRPGARARGLRRRRQPQGSGSPEERRRRRCRAGADRWAVEWVGAAPERACTAAGRAHRALRCGGAKGSCARPRSCVKFLLQLHFQGGARNGTGSAKGLLRRRHQTQPRHRDATADPAGPTDVLRHLLQRDVRAGRQRARALPAPG